MLRTIRRFAVVGVAVGLMAAGLLSPAGAAPGNNGTVKIDGVDVDKQMNANEPHVGCDFSVEWYGFDASNTTSYVSFDAQPPTGTENLLQDVVTLDGDDASGGGSPAGFDGAAFYQLQFGPGDYLHPIQGYHVKVTITTPTANGADVKYKVFWVQGCENPPV